jgi:hypothetical protein
MAVRPTIYFQILYINVLPTARQIARTVKLDLSALCKSRKVESIGCWNFGEATEVAPYSSLYECLHRFLGTRVSVNNASVSVDTAAQGTPVCFATALIRFAIESTNVWKREDQLTRRIKSNGS